MQTLSLMMVQDKHDEDFQKRLAIIQPRLDRIKSTLEKQFNSRKLDYFNNSRPDDCPHIRSSWALPFPKDAFYIAGEVAAWLIGRVDSIVYSGKINVHIFGKDFSKFFFGDQQNPGPRGFDVEAEFLKFNLTPEGDIIHRQYSFEAMNYSGHLNEISRYEFHHSSYVVFIQIFDPKVIYALKCVCDNISNLKKDFTLCPKCIELKENTLARKYIDIWRHKTYAAPNGFGYQMAAKRFKSYL